MRLEAFLKQFCEVNLFLNSFCLKIFKVLIKWLKGTLSLLLELELTVYITNLVPIQCGHLIGDQVLLRNSSQTCTVDYQRLVDAAYFPQVSVDKDLKPDFWHSFNRSFTISTFISFWWVYSTWLTRYYHRSLLWYNRFQMYPVASLYSQN